MNVHLHERNTNNNRREAYKASLPAAGRIGRRIRNACSVVLPSILAIGFAIASSTWLPSCQASNRSEIEPPEKRAGNQRAEKKESKETAPKATSYVDVNGKRLKEGELFVAQRTLSDGKAIIYRKNKREIQALVSALKGDGVTDQELLDPQTWLLWTCQSGVGGCSGNCGINTCTAAYKGRPSTDPRRQSGPQSLGLSYCGCS